MKILQRIWHDFQRGENIDLYLTISISTILGLLNIVNLVPSTWISPLSLSVLALLSFVILGNRYRLETIIERMPARSELLLAEFPKDLWQDLDEAKDLVILGVDLNQTMRRNYAKLAEKLEEGITIKVLLVNPESSACGVAALFHNEPMTSSDKQTAIHRSLRACHELKQNQPDKFDIRLVDHFPPFGAFAIDIKTSQGLIYLWNYAFKASYPNRPKLILRPEDGYWYEFYKEQLDTVWDNATEWSAN